MNRFASLDDSEDEAHGFAFGPSILESEAAASSSAATSFFSSGSGWDSYAASASTAASSTKVEKLDLSAIADELLAAGASAAMMSGSDKSWDFSSFLEASKQTETEIAEEASKKRADLIAQLERMQAADKDDFRDKLNKFQLSRSQRRRRIETKNKGQDLQDKLTTRHQKKSMARRRLNQAKHMY